MSNSEITELSKSSITKLARRAGVKSLSEDCYNTIRNLIGIKLNILAKAKLIVKESHGVKTIMTSDVYKALELLGYNVTQSENLNTEKIKT